MTIPREIEGVFIIVDDDQQQQQEQTASPLMDADEAAVFEMLEGIEDAIWRDYEGDDSSFFYPSSEEGSSSVDDDEEDFEDFNCFHYSMMDGIDFPWRNRENQHTVRRPGGRRPTRGRLHQLQNEIDVDYLSLPSLDTLEELVENTYDEDSVVLTTRRGVRRHDHQHRQLQTEESSQTTATTTIPPEDESSCRVGGGDGSFPVCMKLSERSSQSCAKA